MRARAVFSMPRFLVQRATRPCRAQGTKAQLGSYSFMSSKVDHYRVRAEECCLNAVRAENNSRRIHWLEAAARWVALGRQEGACRDQDGLREPNVCYWHETDMSSGCLSAAT